MAQLPTPTVQGEFTSASLVQGTVTWGSLSNLNDLDQVRVRYARIRPNVSDSPPSRTVLAGLTERTTSWLGFMSNGRNYFYKDAVIRSGFDNTPPSYTDRSVPFSESSLDGWNVWAMARLEV